MRAQFIPAITILAKHREFQSRASTTLKPTSSKTKQKWFAEHFSMLELRPLAGGSNAGGSNREDVEGPVP